MIAEMRLSLSENILYTERKPVMFFKKSNGIDLRKICSFETARFGDKLKISYDSKNLELKYLIEKKGIMYVLFKKDQNGKCREDFMYFSLDDSVSNENIDIPVYTITGNGSEARFEDRFLEIPLIMREVIEGYRDYETRKKMGLPADYSTKEIKVEKDDFQGLNVTEGVIELENPIGPSAHSLQDHEDDIQGLKVTEGVIELENPIGPSVQLSQDYEADLYPARPYYSKLYDGYFITVKNRLMDYFAAANSIPFLPFQQQESANALVKRIDGFLNKRLLPTVEQFIDLYCEESPDERVLKKFIHDNMNGEHKFLFVKNYFFMEYLTFKSMEENAGKSYYPNVSLMTTLPAEQVFPVLQHSAEEFDKLSRCRSRADFKGLLYFKGLDELFTAAMDCQIMLRVNNSEESAAIATIKPNSEEQTRSIVRFFELNWDEKTDGCRGTTCYFNEFTGEPELIFNLSFGKNDPAGRERFHLYRMGLKPTQYNLMRSIDITDRDIPLDLFDELFNNEEMLNWMKKSTGLQ